MLRSLDKRGQITFTDLAAPDFRPEELGRTMGELMAEIHGRFDDGTWVTGVEVFRQLYDRVGFSPLVRLSRVAGIRNALDFGYSKFAANRLKWTGRCDDGVCAV